MSTDDGDRVDQYFVLRYTEVCIIIQYRLNLNHKGDRRRDLRTILTRTRTNFKQKAPTSTGELGVLTVIHRVSPQKGRFLYLHRVPRGMRGASPPVVLLQFHTRTPAQ